MSAQPITRVELACERGDTGDGNWAGFGPSGVGYSVVIGAGDGFWGAEAGAGAGAVEGVHPFLFAFGHLCRI